MNDLPFSNDCIIIVHSKTTIEIVDVKNIFDEMWYIFECFIINIFYFRFFLMEQTQDENYMNIWLKNGKNHSWDPIIFINFKCAPTL